MSIDSIGDFLTIIRNGLMRSMADVKAPYSRLRFDVAGILKDEGFVKDVLVVEKDNKKFIKVFLKYVDGESVIHEIKRVSTPGRRYYASAHELKPVIGGLGVSILTTSHGIFTNKKAKQKSIGGEIICTVW
jgi:small subunit ribosomal protein S8